MSLKVALLEESFSFYNNLFTMYPAAEPLFANTNMISQREKLIKSLVLVVNNLRSPEFLADTLKGLGSRHVEYGALPEHYPLVGNALLVTFEEYLGDEWTEEVKAAWVEAYGAITEIMLEGADYAQAEVLLESVAPAPATATPSTPIPVVTQHTKETKVSEINWALLGGALAIGAIVVVVLLLVSGG
jgi:nitric oxide dioxygenase